MVYQKKKKKENCVLVWLRFEGLALLFVWGFLLFEAGVYVCFERRGLVLKAEKAIC